MRVTVRCRGCKGRVVYAGDPTTSDVANEAAKLVVFRHCDEQHAGVDRASLVYVAE